MSCMFYGCSNLKKIRITEKYNGKLINKAKNENITVEEYDLGDWGNKLNKFINC